MKLPERASQLIREYSKPLTRPDWRTVNPIPYNILYSNAICKYNTNVVLTKFVDSITNQIPADIWFDILSRNLFTKSSDEEIKDICDNYDIDVRYLKAIMHVF